MSALVAADRRTGRLRIVVLGYMVRGPVGGMTWSDLQYLVGPKRMGHDVVLLEDSDDYASCYDPSRDAIDTDPAYGLAYAARHLAAYGMGESWAFFDAHRNQWHGPLADSVDRVCSAADLLINLAGVNPMRPWCEQVPVRVLVDKDPVFTQVNNLIDPARRAYCAGHTALFSFGVNIGLATSSVPPDGLNWRPTRHPIVTDLVAVTPAPRSGRFTTVMQWESYRALEWSGRTFGMKALSFEPYLSVPRLVGCELEIALEGASAPRRLLSEAGWFVEEPKKVTKDVDCYLEYIRSSKGEFTVAKHGYATTRCGWFSERSATYLAAGRPVVVEDTGFSGWLPTGLGVVRFSDIEEAVAGLGEVNARYESHCRAAREIAEEYFGARRILTDLIDASLEPSAILREPPSGHGRGRLEP